MKLFGLSILLNPTQKIILKLGDATIAFTLIFPPVIMQRSGNYFGRGFEFILSLPGSGNAALRIDTYVLTTLWLGVLIVIGLLCFAFCDRNQE